MNYTQLLRLLLSTLLLGPFQSCEQPSVAGSQPTGSLMIAVGYNQHVEEQTHVSRAVNPSDFCLNIRQGSNLIQQFSPIGSGTKNITLEAGLYTVEAYSKLYTTPAFDDPIYGASSQVNIVAQSSSSVTLDCIQTNAGININYTDAFKSSHAVYSTTVTQQGQSLLYGATERRSGYFDVGPCTITVTADGHSYSSPLELRGQRVYRVSVDQEIGTTGNLNVTLHITTTVIDENFDIMFPAPDNGGGGDDGGDNPGTNLLFREEVGDVPVSGTIMFTDFVAWSEVNALYRCVGIVQIQSTSPSANSDYAHASGGNNIYFSQKNTSVEIAGLNTSAGISTLYFGCTGGSVFNAERFTIEVSTNGGLTFTPLTYTRSDVAEWAEAAIGSIPASNNLCLRFTALDARYRLDDIRLVKD